MTPAGRSVPGRDRRSPALDERSARQIKWDCYLSASLQTAGSPSSMNLKDKAFLQSLGDRVRDRRLELKLTQQELGDRCGLHRTFIGSVERGERNVSVLNLR